MRDVKWVRIGAALVLALVALALVADPTLGMLGVLLAPAVPATTRSLTTILGELKTIQDEYKGKAMPQNVGEQFDALAAEAKALQDEAERERQIKGFERFSREVPSPTMPEGPSDGKGDTGPDGSRVVGYLSVGEMFTKSEAFRNYLAMGMPEGAVSQPLDLKTLHERFVPVTQKMVEQKAVPTLGADVISRDRVADIVRSTEQDRLRVRDVLDVSATSSNMVEYITITAAPDAAAPVAAEAAKPEAAMAVGTATAPVRTLAVWLPVTEQMLQDAPQITGMINGELLYDLKRLEERQFLYGAGTGQNLLGLLTAAANVPAITRTVTNTTNIDRIRLGATDVMVRGGEPNAVVVHPWDWDQIVLAKGTDNRYVWAVIEDGVGFRIWGLRVVESVAAKNPANNQRHLLVGDFRRGATVWDRQQASVSVGFINDQFTRNMRTIRAEERLAFGIKRPGFFAKYETNPAA